MLKRTTVSNIFTYRDWLQHFSLSAMREWRIDHSQMLWISSPVLCETERRTSNPISIPPWSFLTAAPVLRPEDQSSITSKAPTRLQRWSRLKESKQWSKNLWRTILVRCEYCSEKCIFLNFIPTENTWVHIATIPENCSLALESKEGCIFKTLIFSLQVGQGTGQEKVRAGLPRNWWVSFSNAEQVLCFQIMVH